MKRYLTLFRCAETSQNFGAPDMDCALLKEDEAQARSVA